MEPSSPTDWQAIAVSQQQRLAQMEKAAADSAVESALTAALGPLPLHDGAGPQLVALLRDQVQLTTDLTTGKQVAVGPGLKPLQDHVKEVVSTAAYQHFLRSGPEQARSGAQPPSPSSGQAAAPAFQAGQATAGWLRGEVPLGAAILAEHQAQQAEQTARGLNDPRTNMRLPMGVNPKS
jgi:hypothetical protein